VRVNTVCGGLIDTDALRHLAEGEAMRKAAEEWTPLGRIGVPEDIAMAVSLLVRPEARWITGQVLVADGGLSLI